MNYKENIKKSRLSIYDKIDLNNEELYIENITLERLLCNELINFSLNGLPLRTRSKVVKEKVCEALGYPIPKSFKKVQPRFPGQNFDIYIQKSLNVQIWNETIDLSRRYVFIKVNENDIITSIKVINGNELSKYDTTGTLTTKYQATMKSFNSNRLFSEKDTDNLKRIINEKVSELPETYTVKPNSMPSTENLLPISEIYNRLLPLVGKKINYLDAIQERNRGAELHKLICQRLGYQSYQDDGTYPDILNQLLEIKLQTSPTIDLGLHSPIDKQKIITINNQDIYSNDIRYAIFEGIVIDTKEILLKNLYVVSGEDFIDFFPLFQGKKQNAKLQLLLPSNFFN